MRVFVAIAFCLSLFLCGCNSESPKTDPKDITFGTAPGKFDKSKSGAQTRD
jgi:hypothetical protein